VTLAERTWPTGTASESRSSADPELADAGDRDRPALPHRRRC
jgi:hypothetical protein